MKVGVVTKPFHIKTVASTIFLDTNMQGLVQISYEVDQKFQIECAFLLCLVFISNNFFTLLYPLDDIALVAFWMGMVVSSKWKTDIMPRVKSIVLVIAVDLVGISLYKGQRSTVQ